MSYYQKPNVDGESKKRTAVQIIVWIVAILIILAVVFFSLKETGLLKDLSSSSGTNGTSATKDSYLHVKFGILDGVESYTVSDDNKFKAGEAATIHLIPKQHFHFVTVPIESEVDGETVVVGYTTSELTVSGVGGYSLEVLGASDHPDDDGNQECIIRIDHMIADVTISRNLGLTAQRIRCSDDMVAWNYGARLSDSHEGYSFASSFNKSTLTHTVTITADADHYFETVPGNGYFYKKIFPDYPEDKESSHLFSFSVKNVDYYNDEKIRKITFEFYYVDKPICIYCVAADR